jgi:hypothetical protein
VAHVGYWDLCEMGYKLAEGFLRYTDWSYQSFSGGTSWLTERAWYRENAADPQRHDLELQRDLVALADIIHVNEYHNQPLLADVKPGKRMVIHHHGCRYRDNPGKFERYETEAGYTRLVSTPDLLTHGSPKYRRNLKWLPSPLEIEELDRNYPRWEERDPEAPLVVAHGYTVASNKGTTEFMRIMDNLSQFRSGRLQVGLINGVQRRQALWYISQCDIYFATFFYGPGLASYEAMAFGKPVLVGCSAEELAAQKDAIGEDLPFIHVTMDTCGKVLSDLAADADLRREWGERGRLYVEKFHDTSVVVRQLKALYEDTLPCRFLVPA